MQQSMIYSPQPTPTYSLTWNAADEWIIKWM